MILGGLSALGLDRGALLFELHKLDISNFELVFTPVDRSGISATHLEVKVPHEHAHRHLHHIESIIDNSTLAESVKNRAKSIFKRLADAEAKIHGIDVNKVHFHEVGAMDAIIDVVGSCIAFDMLGIERFACSKIHVGSGFAEIAHGKFPVPPPAVAELLSGAPIYSTEIDGELITPTGAAIISTLCESYGTIPEMTVEQTAYGAGTREYEKFPNVLRLILGEVTSNEQTTTESERLTLIETNIDDSSPQVLGFVMERAFELGALDCWFTPIQMKKDRPAAMLSILCANEKREVLTKLVFTETTSIGVRVKVVERECLDRRLVTVNTEYGDIDVKIATLGGKIVNAMPEYDHVKRAAIEHGVPFKTVRGSVVSKLSEKMSSSTASA